MLSHQNKGELRPPPFKKNMHASREDISLCEEAEMWRFLQTGVLTEHKLYKMLQSYQTY